jgi:hypothetical protein
MGPEQPFRFLDLPKELRLMIYEYLPIKTTYHKCDLGEGLSTETSNSDDGVFRLFVESAESGNNLLLPSGKVTAQASIVLIHKSIPGLAVLSTCREIETEARSVLQPRLQSLSVSPYQITVNSFALSGGFNLAKILRCMCHSGCKSSNDIRIVADSGHFELIHGEPKPLCSGKTRDVHIAIRNQFVDRDTATSRRCEKRMSFLNSCMECMKQAMMGFFLSRSTPDQCPDHNLDVVFHMALLSAEEKAACDLIRPIDMNFYGKKSDGGPFVGMQGGADIGSDV